MDHDQEYQVQELQVQELQYQKPQDQEPQYQKPQDQEPQYQKLQDQEPQYQKFQDQEPQYQKTQEEEPLYQQPQLSTMQVVAVSTQPAAPAPAINVQMVGASRVGPKPSMISCSICQRSVLTNVKYVTTQKTHLWAFLLFIFCCPCMFVPYVTKCCRQADHTCPGCNSFIGSYPEH